jgi:hypothetical protein
MLHLREYYTCAALLASLVDGILCHCLSAADENQRAPQSSKSTSVSIGTDALLRGDAMLSGSDTLSAVMAPPARLQDSPVPAVVQTTLHQGLNK